MIDLTTAVALVVISIGFFLVSVAGKRVFLVWISAAVGAESTANSLVFFGKSNPDLAFVGYALDVMVLASLLVRIPDLKQALRSILVVSILILIWYFAVDAWIPVHLRREAQSWFPDLCITIAVAPLFEELCFRWRGVEYTKTLAPWPSWLALSLLFAAMHTDVLNPWFYLSATFSVAMYVLRSLPSGSWRTTFLAHGMWNAFFEVVRV